MEQNVAGLETLSAIRHKLGRFGVSTDVNSINILLLVTNVAVLGVVSVCFLLSWFHIWQFTVGG